MELKATSLGKRLAQHPYDRATILHAGIKVAGDRHEYLIPFNQLLAIECKRGMVWGEMEFQLADNKVVRLHGTEWSDTQRFYHLLNERWRSWSAEMSEVAAELLSGQLALISERIEPSRWLTRNQLTGVQRQLQEAFAALPIPTSRLSEFDNCRTLWQQCHVWLQDVEGRRAEHNQAFTESMLKQYATFFLNKLKARL